MENSKDCIPGVYKVSRPENPLPLVFDSPHSGRVYPAGFDHVCPPDLLESAEDNQVDDLFAGAPRQGGTLLCALFPRTWIDANRAMTDIDPALLAEKWPGPIRPTARSHAGIGLIRRLVRPGVPLYNRKLSAAEIQHRIETFYKPYHGALEAVLDQTHYNFGQVWHINAHSMPGHQAPVDFVLGDRDGATCGRGFTHALRDCLTGMGYSVAINHPYRGAEILRRHAAPGRGRHSLQLEVSKALYWDEARNKKSSGYSRLKDDLEVMISFCAGWARDGMAAALAAD